MACLNLSQIRLQSDLDELRNRPHIGSMPRLNDCKTILRLLIAKADPNGVPLAKRAVDHYLDSTPAAARKSGLRLMQEDLQVQLNAVVGDQRAFAESVNAYIEEKLAE